MALIRFLTDEDVYGAVAVQLRANGFDAISTPDVERRGASDASQLSWAAQENRVLVTFNVSDFAQLHYQWLEDDRHHAGMIVSRQRPIGEVVRGLLHLAKSLDDEDMQDRLEYLSNW